MKKVIISSKALLFLAVCFLTISCAKDGEVILSKEEYNKLKNITEPEVICLGTFKSNDSYHGTNLYITVIDSCEYITNLSGNHGDIITHRGRCKFCAKK